MNGKAAAIDSPVKSLNPNNGGIEIEREKKPKVVVIMGPTGSGKSKLAIDLASHFPVEIINADSMQVYQGLDVLTNKVPLHEQNGIPHHLLGSISPTVEFTAKEFRDSAIPIIDEIVSRNSVPFIVGGTNYYIQALVSPFLLDDSAEDIDESDLSDLPGDEHKEFKDKVELNDSSYTYDLLKDLDPIAANRIHPNNHRKITQYLRLYARTGVLPSELYQGKAAEILHVAGQNWGRITDFRFNCCFICVDAALSVLDRYVEQRVDSMINAGLLTEVYDIFNPKAIYTRGLRQAIGVREFENFLSSYHGGSSDNETPKSTFDSLTQISRNKGDIDSKENIKELLLSTGNTQSEVVLDAIDKVKLNTRRLVRRQKRRINRLQTLSGWNIHYVDATEFISSKSDEVWAAQVVEPAMTIIKSFLNEDTRCDDKECTTVKLVKQDLWTQYICKACGDKILRGLHEWEEHLKGRCHRKRICRLRKSQAFRSVGQQ